MDISLKQFIIDVVIDRQGVKATELAVDIITKKFPGFLTTPNVSQKLISVIEEMVKDEELVEVEYILPSMTYRIKSFLLPRGSTVRIVNANRK